MRKRLAIVINSFNRLSLLKNCIANLIELMPQVSVDYLIMIVDAGSDDDSLLYIEDCRQKHDFIFSEIAKNGESISFSEGCNIGVNASLKLYPDLDDILLFETDNYFKNSAALSNALAIIEDPNYACVGFTVEKYDGKKITYGNTKPTLLGFLIGQTLSKKFGFEQVKDSWQTTGNVRVNKSAIIFTSPLLIKAKAWKEVGGMDSKIFPFSDSDADLCLSFLKAGYTNMVLDTPGVIHDNKNQSSAWSQKRVIDYHIAHSLLLKKHLSTPPLLFQTFIIIKYSIELLGGRLLSKPQEYINSRKTLLRYHFNRSN
ncbi:glycosyltransferase family 2 protein [Pedobacter sp. SD-b]|uniref:Glycosyltransferase family 2 protein n=1 Tax=Pedobacter segetis TaxID=2793069 RepID=A0ABS1BGS1_9SPHI|nr:glycosyltransferase family 2 protein [Pedobacter segetis]MBK0382064.1 glycosyltransferase family 2 protein [Pedobacter segetis]